MRAQCPELNVELRSRFVSDYESEFQIFLAPRYASELHSTPSDLSCVRKAEFQAERRHEGIDVQSVRDLLLLLRDPERAGLCCAIRALPGSTEGLSSMGVEASPCCRSRHFANSPVAGKSSSCRTGASCRIGKTWACCQLAYLLAEEGASATGGLANPGSESRRTRKEAAQAVPYVIPVQKLANVMRALPKAQRSTASPLLEYLRQE